MEKSDSKRLSQYMATAAALLGGTAAQAQYQYTDISDTTIVDGIFESVSYTHLTLPTILRV